tara:strand:- start:1286 stop:2791 length:1506 start_codon:yes stop_codon:yes gene_type:complete
MNPIKGTRREILQGLAAGGLAAAAAPASAIAKEKKPNIVFFLGEGLRWDEFGFMGNDILKTPHMDRLAREGAVFKNAFCTNALCLPSRATFLTGAYSHRTGAVTNDANTVPDSFPMLCDVLRDAGYETAFIGKSHIGGALLDHEWDYYFGFKGQADYLHPKIVEGRNGKYGPETVYDEYVDDLLTDKAVEWVDSRSGDKPFVLFLWFYAPHAPFYRPRRMLNDFNGVPIPIPENFDDDLKGYPGKPPRVAAAENKIGTSQVFNDDPRTLEELVKNHYAGVQSNDEDVGRVMASLEKKKMLDDTVLFLSSDHGFFLGEHTFYDKRLMYEPSIRIPMMIRYPRTIRGGTVRDEMVLNVDAAQTLLDMAGVSAPATMQGRSFYPLARGKDLKDWRKDWMYEFFEYPAFEAVPPCRGVRTERWKYIHYFLLPESYELYDLENDPNEDHNLYGQPGYEAITQQLAARLKELRRETLDNYHWEASRIAKMAAKYYPAPTDLVAAPGN